ncbi:MAG: hypothetical protein OK404_03740 [Thaumarchaeota archaeon]|nr:hypothetical protein [Nitrososphaerota archaeon]
MQARISWGFILFALTFLVYLACLNGIWATDHATSFVQLGYSIWHDHSIVLGKAGTFTPNTVDDFIFRGNYYSALAPGTSILALPFLAIAFTISGGYTVFGWVLLFSEAFVALTGALAAYFTYKIAEMFFRKSTSMLIGFSYSFASISWPLATYFFQSDVSAMLVALTALLALKAEKSPKGRGLLLGLCGLVAGVAFTVDYVDAVLVPILATFFLVGARFRAASLVRSIFPFVLGILPGFLLIGLYNYAAFGTPFISTEQVYLAKNSVFGGFSTPITAGLWLDLFSPARGLFVFVPLAILGALGLYRGVRTPDLRAAFLLFLAIFLGILIPYSMWYNPDGGLTYGPRFIVAAIPFILIQAGLVIDSAKGKGLLIVYSLFVAGAVTNGMAALTTAIPPYSGPLSSPFLATIMPAFLVGRLDAFWAPTAGQYLWVDVAFILIAGTVIPLALTHMKRRNEFQQPATEPSGAKPVSELTK